MFFRVKPFKGPLNLCNKTYRGVGSRGWDEVTADGKDSAPCQASAAGEYAEPLLAAPPCLEEREEEVPES